MQILVAIVSLVYPSDVWATKSKLVVRERPKSHGACASRTKSSLKSREALPQHRVKVSFRAMISNNALSLSTRHDVEKANEVVLHGSIGRKDAWNEGEALNLVGSAVLLHLLVVGRRRG